MTWRGDSRELYYETPDSRIMGVDIRSGPDGVIAGASKLLFSADIEVGMLHSFDSTPDGKKFLIVQTPRTRDNATKLTIVSNWQGAHAK